MKTRLKFSKGGVLRYIGHLDLMRYFQKAMRRAGIPIAYSEGFHPHQKMAFALPLGVGMTSEGEYMDVDLDDSLLTAVTPDSNAENIENTGDNIEINYTYDFSRAINDLNSTMAEGVKILDFAALPEKNQKAMASVAAATYYVYFKNCIKMSYNDLISLKDTRYEPKAPMVVEKRTKKSTRQVNLADHIFSFEILPIDEALCSHMSEFLPDYEYNGFKLDIGDPLIKITLSHGSEENIKPELFLSWLLEKDVDETARSIGTHRIDLLMRDDSGSLVPLL